MNKHYLDKIENILKIFIQKQMFRNYI